MNLVYSLEPVPYTTFSVFLAGPTPRKHSTAKSWRPEMVRTLNEVFNTTSTLDLSILMPEDRTGTFHGDATRQREWEYLAISSCSLLLFWVPRSLQDGMPALTTNIEFGFWIKEKDVLLGFPENSDHMAYMSWLLAKEKKQDHLHSMSEISYKVLHKYLSYVKGLQE